MLFKNEPYFKLFLFLFHVHGYFTCHVFLSPECSNKEARRGSQTPWNRSYRQLGAALWVLRIEAGFSVGSAGVLDCWVMSPAPALVFVGTYKCLAGCEQSYSGVYHLLFNSTETKQLYSFWRERTIGSVFLDDYKDPSIFLSLPLMLVAEAGRRTDSTSIMISQLFLWGKM